MPEAGRVRRGALSAALVGVPTAWLAATAVGGILHRLGHPGAPLDDAYIHFQYARAIAEGHPFRFHAGDPFTMGATSLLWPLVLAPFWAIGFRGEAILWPAWLISFASLALLAHEVFLLAKRLAGRACAAGAAAMVLSLSSLTWFAASGMEVVPFALCLARVARRSSEWVEAEEGAPPRATELLVLAWLAPFLRPEGAVASVLAAAALLGFHRTRRGLGFGLAALAAPLAPMLLSLLLTGSAASNTAQVKLLVGSPYFTGAALAGEIGRNLRVLVGTLLEGEVWSAEFLPHGGAAFAMAGLLAVAVRGYQTRSYFRAAAILTLALTIAAPCFYVTFLWNRLRYLWPFAPMWLLGIACLARILGDGLGALRAPGRLAGPIACGVASGMLWSAQSGTLSDLADSASGIERQQATLGRWAKENLPGDAFIGVNDTGAIGYFGDRRTFDVVGLTTKGEGHYWVAGAASRFEHYERLFAKDRASLPSHYIIYPDWMACEAVLGRPLHDATVLDSTILGGRTMRVFEADYTLLGSGEQPWTPGLDVYDALDVADLESEAAHDYVLDGARDGDQIVVAERAPGALPGVLVADGGRTNRAIERFTVDASPGVASRATVRLSVADEARVRVFSDGVEVATLEPDPKTWSERSFPLPKGGRQTIELRAEGATMTVFHYWLSRDAAP